MAIRGYYLGCPGWGLKSWVGRLFPTGTKHGEGKQPYVFMHAPDDTFAPENAYAFHGMVSSRVAVGELPTWPGQPRQLGLF